MSHCKQLGKSFVILSTSFLMMAWLFLELVIKVLLGYFLFQGMFFKVFLLKKEHIGGYSIMNPEGLDAPRLHFYVTNIKGDWKFFRQLFNLSRHASTEEAIFGKHGGRNI